MSDPIGTPSTSVRLVPRVKVWLEVGERYVFGLGLTEILEAIGREGTIKAAAARLGKSYRHIWGRVKDAEEALGERLVLSQVGGQEAQRSALTPAAQQLVTRFRTLRQRMAQRLKEEFAATFGAVSR